MWCNFLRKEAEKQKKEGLKCKNTAHTVTDLQERDALGAKGKGHSVRFNAQCENKLLIGSLVVPEPRSP